jgi:diguanylate cyclase (GGDEF)-like protein
MAAEGGAQRTSVFVLPAGANRLLKRALHYLPRGQTLSEDVWRVRHRTLSFLLRAHVLGAFCFALIVGRGLAKALGAAAILSVFACLASTNPRRRKFVSSMTALGLVTASAVLVDLSGGVIEMHFHFFVMVGLLTLYQDWLPFIVAICFVVAHHAIFGVLEPSAVYDHSDAIAHPFKWALIHGGFVLAASITSIVAWRLNEEQGFRDALTRLPNRALFQDRVGHALARADRRPGALAVLFVDLAGFKDVNPSLGHAAGDTLLCSVAERLRACVRPADTAARLGGDEFAVLLEDITTEEEATRVAQRLLTALTVPFSVTGVETTINASIGIAFNSGDDTVDELLRNADVAMYSVKDSGKGRYELFEAHMHATLVNRVELERQLRGALDANQFVLHYQPVVSLDTGRLVGLEALIRWDHPTRGLLSPAAFIDVAEETGAIIPIGTWVLETACHQAREWQQRYPDDPFALSVNLSPTQVFQVDSVETVRGALERSGLAPDSLVLELIEDVVIKDVAAASARLSQLKDLGVRLAVDDFGTGYSSLNYLRSLPFDILKIDKTIIDDITIDPTKFAVGKLIIDLAHTLGLRTVAEGVERPEQTAALRELKCHAAQGYLFSRPLPAARIETVIARWNADNAAVRAGLSASAAPQSAR